MRKLFFALIISCVFGVSLPAEAIVRLPDKKQLNRHEYDQRVEEHRALEKEYLLLGFQNSGTRIFNAPKVREAMIFRNPHEKTYDINEINGVFMVVESEPLTMARIAAFYGGLTEEKIRQMLEDKDYISIFVSLPRYDYFPLPRSLSGIEVIVEEMDGGKVPLDNAHISRTELGGRDSFVFNYSYEKFRNLNGYVKIILRVDNADIWDRVVDLSRID